MISSEIRSYVKELSDFVREKFYADFKTPSVVFELKPGPMNGRAFPAENKVDFNIKTAQMNGDDFKKTIKHEIAHLMTYHVYKDKTKQAHGPEFRHMCKLLGHDGSKSSTYLQDDKDYKNVVRHEYKCSCGKHYVTPVTHKKIVAGKANLSCAHCKSTVKYDNIVVKVTSNTPRYVKD